MNAVNIWQGFEYAHTYQISRGVDYYRDANRVLVIAVFDRVLPGNSKKTTYVKVAFLDPETGEPQKRKRWDRELGMNVEEDKIDDVRAREIFMRWDEYEDETETRRQDELDRERERERKQREWAEQRERDRIAREIREADERKKREEDKRLKDLENEAILRSLTIKGISRTGVQINDNYVSIPIETIRRWLGIRTTQKVA